MENIKNEADSVEYIESTPKNNKMGIVTKDHATRSLLWKLDRKIVPLTALLYLSAFLDRGNVGNAKLQGLLVVLGKNSDVKYSIILSAFYITYIVFNVPGNMLSRYITPNKSLALGALVWGVASTALAGSKGFAGVLVSRLFIGLGEAAFGSAVPLYYSQWYRRDEIAIRNSWYIGAGSLAGAFGGLIAFGVQHIHSHVATWRILMLIEGLPTIVLAISIFFFLPSTPELSKHITEEERAFLLARLEEPGVNKRAGFQWSALSRALLSPTTYLNGVIYLGVNLTLASISGFLPTIIKNFGYTNAKAQLYTVPPYAVAFVCTLLISYASDKARSRGPFVVLCMMLSAIGFAILLAVQKDLHVRYFATFLVVTGAFACIPLMLSWAANTAGSHSASAVRLGMMNSIGQCFSILAAFSFPAKQSPVFRRGMILNIAFNLLAAVTAIGLTLYYRMENARRDREEGTGTPSGSSGLGEKASEDRVEAEGVDVGSSLHDRARGFRYMV